MTLPRTSMPQSLRLLAIATVLSVSAAAANADDYDEVNQLLRAGKHAEAVARADQYLAAKPRDPQMRFLKGVALTAANRAPEAIAVFSRLTEDYPELPEPYNNLAVLYAGQGQYDKARAALEMAIRINPGYATAHENLGDVYAKLASQAYSKALQLDAGNTAVQPKLALIRELFAPAAGGKGAAVQPAATAAASTKPAAARAPAPAAATPAAVPAPSPAAAPGNASRDVQSAVQAWANAWSSRDVPGYLAAYSKEFEPPGGQSRKDWEDERRARILGKARISVHLSEMSVSVSGNRAVAKFRQDYSADALNVSGRRMLELVKVGERWVIMRESAGV